MTTTTEAPAFVDLYVGSETPFWECQTCMALVLDGGQTGHLEWHQTQEATA